MVKLFPFSFPFCSLFFLEGSDVMATANICGVVSYSYNDLLSDLHKGGCLVDMA